MVEIMSLAVAAGYGIIKGVLVQAMPSLGGIVDYLLLALGYWKKDTAWGQGLLFGAVVNLAATLGLGTWMRSVPSGYNSERVIA
ncbi:MAG: hypothetical protein QW267_06665 [Sulfolobales archaeon]